MAVDFGHGRNINVGRYGAWRRGAKNIHDIGRWLRGAPYSIEQAAPFTTAKRDMIATGNSPWLTWMIDHDGAVLMRYSVKTLEEIVEAMPRYLQTLGAGKAVREAMRDHFHAVPWESQIQPKGRKGDKLRVWLTGDLAKLKIAHNLTSAQVRAAYLTERATSNADAAAHEADDLDE